MLMMEAFYRITVRRTTDEPATGKVRTAFPDRTVNDIPTSFISSFSIKWLRLIVLLLVTLLAF